MTMREDPAVASVVGTLLVVGALAGVLVSVRLVWMPAVERGEEADLARQIEAALGRFAAALRVPNASASQEAVLPLAPRSTGFFQGADVPGNAAFLPGADSFELTAQNAVVRSGPPGAVAGPETWRPVSPGTALTDVAALDGLRVRLPSGVASGNDGDSVVLTVNDRAGARVVTWTFYVERYPSGYNLMIRVTDPTGAHEFHQGTAYFLQSALPGYWFDVLDPDYRVRPLLAAANGPFTISLEVRNVRVNSGNVDLTAEYAVSYQRAVGGVSLPVPTGPTVPQYTRPVSGGVVVVDARNQEFVTQTWRVSAGGLLLQQPDGATFAARPSIALGRGGGAIAADVHLPVLAGSPAAVSHAGDVRIATVPGARTDTVVAATGVQWTIRTAHPAAWAETLTTEATRAGLTASECQIETGADRVTLRLAGTVLFALREVQHDVRLG